MEVQPFTLNLMLRCSWFVTKILSDIAGIANTVKTTLNESCVQILSPKRRVDILRDAMECKQQKRPYCITFCGVNGVGKSTNLAKVRNILISIPRHTIVHPSLFCFRMIT